jgi:hypothetical protein
MAYSTVPKVRRDGVIQLIDGTGSPVTLDIAYEEGNFTFDQPGGGGDQAAQTIIRDRGTISTVRKGDDEPITGSFSAFFRQFTDGSEAGSVLDFVTKSGNYASNVSTGTAGAPFVEHYAIDIKYTAEGTNFGDDADHTVTLGKAVCTVSFTEGDPSSFTINFTAYAGATYTGPS